MREHNWQQAGAAPHEIIRKDGSVLQTGHTTFSWECEDCGLRCTTTTMSTTTLHIPRPWRNAVQPENCDQAVVDQIHDL